MPNVKAGGALPFRARAAEPAGPKSRRAQYAAPVISPMPADTRRLVLIACTVTALATGALGLFAAQSVRPDRAYSMFTPGPGAEQQEAVDRGYWQAVASGDCAPPHARRRFWLG